MVKHACEKETLSNPLTIPNLATTTTTITITKITTIIIITITTATIPNSYRTI